MGSILIAMPKTDDSNNIASTIKELGAAFEIEICATGAEVLQVSNARDYGVVICTKRLKDMAYADLSEYLPDNFGMIVLTSDVSLEMLSDNMLKLMMPFKRRELISVIETVLGDLYYRLKKKKRSAPPKRRAEDQKLIDQAKAMLMERNGMSEPEAFRYMQKSSMDNGRTMVETAQMLLLLSEE